VPDEFHGDEILLTSHETPSFSLLATSAKLMIFNVMKLSMKLPLRLALAIENWKAKPARSALVDGWIMDGCLGPCQA